MNSTTTAAAVVAAKTKIASCAQIGRVRCVICAQLLDTVGIYATTDAKANGV